MIRWLIDHLTLDLCRRTSARRDASRAERDAMLKANTQAIHKARKSKREALHAELRQAVGGER